MNTNRLLAKLQPDAKPGLWIDGTDYCARLFGAPPPWLDVTAGVAWMRKAQDLLRADVLELDAVRIIDAACAARADLRSAMAAKSRGGYALKTLLADEPLRALLTEWVGALRSALPNLPLCLRIASPRAAVGKAWTLAHGVAPDDVPDEDLVDSAALYLADFLRGFSTSGLDALLLDEGAGPLPDADGLALYQSVLNVAAGYQWATGLACPGGTTAAALPSGFGFAMADAALTVPTVIRIADAAWTGGDACSGASMRQLRIPENAQPEDVLQRLKQLRG
jgi:hypothetical protein